MLRLKSEPWLFRERFPELGRGGEAVTYRLKADTVAKVWHQPTDPVFKDNPMLQEAAVARIREMQHKLFAFPTNIPPNVVGPTGVLQQASGHIFGYVMPFIAGVPWESLTRADSTVLFADRMQLLTHLHDLISGLHRRGVVGGDLNDNNFLVMKGVPFLIDTDPIQFGRYHCRTFHPHFTAPELLQVIRPPKRRIQTVGDVPAPTMFRLKKPHCELTDWYSFLAIAMRLLTFTGPFGGTVNGMEHADRLARRLTVFDRSVIYPQIARPMKDVPRPVLEMFVRAFALGDRFVPDREVFQHLSARATRRMVAMSTRPAPTPSVVVPFNPPSSKEKWSWIRSRARRIRWWFHRLRHRWT